MNICVCKVWFEKEKVFVRLNDERVLAAPLDLYPRLKNATSQQQREYELWNDGKWIHWEALDEDLSLDGFLKFERTN